MSVICRFFGHRPRENDYSGGEYMRALPGAIDGIGREHATLYATCPRCGVSYRAGQIHLPKRQSEAYLEGSVAALKGRLGE